MNKNVIQVEGISKRYQLGTIGYGSLQHDLRAWWAKLRGKEDPNSQIGQKSRLDLNGEFWALKDIDFTVGQGDRVGIIGRNGAGKSTLLKLLSRVTSPTTGRIRVKGRIASLLEVGTGFHPELTGRENVFLNGAILGMKRREIQAKFDEIVDFAGVAKFIDTPVKRYSSGMYVRLAFSVAAHLDSEILVVDEVLAVGDAEFQDKCIGKMRDVSSGQGRTVLFVSHNIASITRLCNRGILLANGQMQFTGPMDETVRLYLGHSKGESAEPKLEWVNSSPAVPGEKARVEKYWIADQSGAPSDPVLRNSLSYYLHLDLEVKTTVPNLCLFLTVYSETGDVVFVSDIQHSVDAARGIRTPGRKRLRVEIPRNLLLTRPYYLEVSCLNHFESWILPGESGQRIRFNYFNDDLRFDIDYSDANHAMTAGRQPGEVSPHLQWILD